MTEAQKEILEAGKAAYRSGVKFNRNPFRYREEGSDRFQLWRTGWNLARKEANG